jgi:hypothetical protein
MPVESCIPIIPSANLEKSLGAGPPLHPTTLAASPFAIFEGTGGPF